LAVIHGAALDDIRDVNFLHMDFVETYGELRPAAGAGCFDLPARLILPQADADLLAALGARDVEAIRRHLVSSSFVEGRQDGMKAAGESIQGRGAGSRRRSFITSWGPMGFAALSSKPLFKIAAVAGQVGQRRGQAQRITDAFPGIPG
jgi:hypothetical protein